MPGMEPKTIKQAALGTALFAGAAAAAIGLPLLMRRKNGKEAQIMSSTFASIRGIGRLTVGEMGAEVRQGARFVVFEYVWSFLLVSRRKTSAVFFLRPGESVFWKSLPYNLMTLALGWWSIPWGPAFTIGAVKDNLQGGRDVTNRLIEQILDAADRQIKPQKRRRA